MQESRTIVDTQETKDLPVPTAQDGTGSLLLT
jgi:hypothetical protein